jgi:hypothetical protein
MFNESAYIITRALSVIVTALEVIEVITYFLLQLLGLL